MSALCLYLDEDARREALLQGLRARSVDVITVASAGMLRRSAREQLNWAQANNRVIYSFNIRDFSRLHTTLLEQGQSHAGIILSQQGYSVGTQIRGILRLIAACVSGGNAESGIIYEQLAL